MPKREVKGPWVPLFRGRVRQDIRVAMIDDRLSVFHDCKWGDVPVKLQRAADYAERQFGGGKATVTKNRHAAVTGRTIRSSEPKGKTKW